MMAEIIFSYGCEYECKLLNQDQLFGKHNGFAPENSPHPSPLPEGEREQIAKALSNREGKITKLQRRSLAQRAEEIVRGSCYHVPSPLRGNGQGEGNCQFHRPPV